MYSKRSGIRRKAVKGGFLPMFAPLMGMMGNPMEMMGKLMGRGVVHPQYEYSGAGVVNPQYEYQGGRSHHLHPRHPHHPHHHPHHLHPKGGMSAGEFFNPMTSPLSPLSWAKSMFGMGQVGGKKRSSARGQKVAHLMRTQGMTLGQASKHLKNMGE